MNSQKPDTKKVIEPVVTTAIILDATYLFLALYNKLEGQWKKKSNKAKHKNSYFDGYEFINYYFDNIPIYINDIIASLKLQSDVDDKTKLAKIYLAKGSKTTWRNNVISNYKNNLPDRIIPLIDIIIAKEIGIKDIEIFQTFNLESDDCVAIITKKLQEQNKNIFINIVSNNKRLVQLNDNRTTVVNIQNEQIHTKDDILSNTVVFAPNKYLFFLILKGDPELNIPNVFFDEKTDLDYDTYYDNNELIVEECQDIILAERLRCNYLVCDYNSIPKKLVINFVKNNSTI
jgi:hypothetical protein